MILIYFICFAVIPFVAVDSEIDPITFLSSSSLGHLNLESQVESRVLVDRLMNLGVFDYSFDERLVFYLGDYQLQQNEFISVIKAINLTNFQTYDVHKLDHGVINALALDWHSMMIYWADFKEEYIAVGEVDVKQMIITKQKVLISQNLSHLKSLCVDPISRSLYWLRSGETTWVESAGLDGSRRTVLFEDSNIKARDLKIDTKTQLLLWLDETHDRITTIDLKGGGRSHVKIPDLGNDRPQFLAASGGRIYYLSDMSISSVPEKENNSLIAQFHMRFNYQPYSVMLFNRQMQVPMKGNFTCVPAKYQHLTNTGETGCNFLCLSSPSNPQNKCICPTGISSGSAVASPISFKADSVINLSKSYICPRRPQKFLLVARPPKIFMLSLDDKLEDHSLWPIGISPNPRGTLVRVDFDPKSEYLYWVDNAIYRLKLGKRNPTAVIESTNGALQTLDGLAVDWVVGNLYWSTGGNRQIWVSRLDGSWPRLLLTLEDFSVNATGDPSDFGASDAYGDETTKRRPTALAIDPINRYLFFNVWSGTRGRIERTWLDGTHRKVIVDHNHTVWPNGIALDFEARHLYYVDAYLGVISRVDYSGENPKQIVSGHLQHPFGFDLLGENLYWSDWQTLSISQINKRTGENLRVLKTIGVDEALMGIRAVDLTTKNTYTSSVCEDKMKSGCSHLCFMLPAQSDRANANGSPRNVSKSADESDLYYCGCPPEYALDADGKTCIVPDSMLLYSLDGTGIRRMSLPKSRLRPSQSSSRTPLRHHHLNDPYSSLSYVDVELAAAETAAMASNQIFNQVPLPFLHRVVRFDVHISEERIYWVEDSAPQCISVAFLNGTGKETLLCLFQDAGGFESNQTNGDVNKTSSSSGPQSQTRDSIVGLALDWLTNALYFCVEGERPRLEVIDLKYRSYILPSSLPSSFLAPPPGISRRPKAPKSSRRGNWQPKRVRRNIVPPWFLHSPDGVDPAVEDYDFYSYDVNPEAERLAKNIDNYRLVLLHNLSSPRDIVVHPKMRYLFWLDGTHNARFNIFSAGLDGRNHRLIWNGVGMVMSLAIDYTTDRLYWMNWVTKCIESISLDGEDWFSVNPVLPSDVTAFQNPESIYDDSPLPPSPATDFHPYAIDVFQGAVLFSELTTQSVYRVQIPTSRASFTTGSQLNLPADLLLRGPSSPLGRQNFLVLGLFVAGFDRQAGEPGHRCAPLSSANAFYPQASTWNYPYGLQNHQQRQTGPICQALCLGAPSPHSVLGGRNGGGGSGGGGGGAQQSVFRGRNMAGGYPPSLLDDRSPRFTCACPTQFTLASDGYSCLEPRRSMMMVTTGGSINRYAPDDQPVTNLLSLSLLSLPSQDQLSADGSGLNLPPSWHSVVDQVPPFAVPNEDVDDPDTLTDPLVFARRWAARHHVAAVALEELTNSGLFFLLQPTSRRRDWTRSAPLQPARGKSFRQGSEGPGGREPKDSSTANMRAGIPFVRLGFLEFATGEVTLWEGGPLVSMAENTWDFNIKCSSGDLGSQSSHSVPIDRPRWSLTFDPVNQIVFWSDAITGLMGAENSRSGRTIGLVANLTENSRTILEIVVEPRSGQLFQLTSNKLEPGKNPFQCRIEVTYLDGSEARVLYDSSKYSVCPHSLTYSPKLAQLFWVDPSKRRICSINVASGIGGGTLKPETVVVDVEPITKSLIIFPEGSHDSPSPGSALWLTWMEPLSRGVSFGSENRPIRLFYVPLDTAYTGGMPAVTQKPLSPPPGLSSYVMSSGNQLFLVPMRGGGLGDLSWHPCAGPSHGECSQICLPKATASSPSLPLYPGPLTPHPPLSSPQPQSLWRTVRRCACALGSRLLNTSSLSDEGTVCSRIPHCLPPNMLCRSGLTTESKKTRENSYYLVGEPFPQRGACIPAHKVCDGVANCLDGSDEVDCPQVCPEYECDNGLCLPFSSRCNDVLECDSDESCCGKDQFECRRPRHSHPFLLFSPSGVAPGPGRCLPSSLVCNGRPDCADGWDEASCEHLEIPEHVSAVVRDLAVNKSLLKLTEAGLIDFAGRGGAGDFPYIHTVFIVAGVIVLLVILSLIAYFCSKKWSKSSYTVQTDVLLIPTDKDCGAKGEGRDRSGGPIRGGKDFQEPLIAGKTTIKSTASRHRKSGRCSRTITSKVTVLPPSPPNDFENWYCPSCSSKCGHLPPAAASRSQCHRSHKYSRYLSRNSKANCHCGARLTSAETPENGVYWTQDLSKCPPAPPPSSLPSPPPSPTATPCLFEGGHSTSPPPAPPPSKLHEAYEYDYDEEVGDYEEEDSSHSCSESSSRTTSPLRCRHHRRHPHNHQQRYRPRRRPQYHEASASSTTSVEQHTGGRRRPRHKRVCFRSDMDGLVIGGVESGYRHCPHCGSRQRKRGERGQRSSRRSRRRQRHVMRHNTFAVGETTAVQQHQHHTMVTTYSRVEPISNIVPSSNSSSAGHKDNSNQSSEFYPRETMNPPPSPINESSYSSIPTTVLKHPDVKSRNNGLSNLPGPIKTEGLYQLPLDPLASGKEPDKGLIAKVMNLGRSNVGTRSPPLCYSVGNEPIIPPQFLTPSGSKCLTSTSSYSFHPHCHKEGMVNTEVASTTTATTSSATAIAKTTKTTTTIQNVHVVIVTSKRDHTHQYCECCSDVEDDNDSSLSDIDCFEDDGNSTLHPAYPVIMPDEPREQAEGAESEDANRTSRVPFTQFASALSSPKDV